MPYAVVSSPFSDDDRDRMYQIDNGVAFGLVKKELNHEKVKMTFRTAAAADHSPQVVLSLGGRRIGLKKCVEDLLAFLKLNLRLSFS